MKKLLFVLPSYQIGGTTVSVKNMLLTLQDDRYEKIVLPLNPVGDLAYLYEKECIIDTCLVLQVLTSETWRIQRNRMYRLFSIILRVLCRRFGFIRRFLFRYYAKKIEIKYNFDTIVSCQEGVVTEFVSFFTTKKVAWVRCDYKRYLQKINKRTEISIYKRYDKIICVSDEMRNVFISVYPQLSLNTIRIFNAQNSSFIKQMAVIDDRYSFTKGLFYIVSIGRFDPVKRFSYIPRIAKELSDQGLLFKWLIIGDGIERSAVEKNIKELGVCDSVECIGIKSNPYYYIANSNLVVSLSLSEACPRIINEAKILHTPVVCTDFTSAYEYINSGYDGIINEINLMSNSIKLMIQDKELYNRIKARILNFEFDNHEILDTLNQVL